jgi:tRNA threonylcarbamoyladenosine biosynthesis protein TsaB
MDGSIRILALDTSAGQCSAALLADGQLTQRLEPAARRHGELLLGMMEDLLGSGGMQARDLDAFAFARGPGSFTGLRIAAAVVQGAALAAGKPVVGVSTLAALAQGYMRAVGATRVLCALDARMDEVYFGAYAADEIGLMRPVLTDCVTAPERVAVPDQGEWHAVGSGWGVHGAALRRACGLEPISVEPERGCEAKDVATLAADAYGKGLAVDAADAVPVYLRDRVTSSPA